MPPNQKLRFAALVLVTGSILAACESSSSSNGNGLGSFDAGGGFDAARADAVTPADGSLPDSTAAAPFEGVWQGMQNGAIVEVANAAGCTRITGSVNGTVCDECVGTYVVGDAGTAAVVARCQPLAACSVSPPHTNTGTFTQVAGGALTYFYDYGGGTASVDVQPTQRAPGDVCRIIDAGAGD